MTEALELGEEAKKKMQDMRSVLILIGVWYLLGIVAARLSVTLLSFMSPLAMVLAQHGFSCIYGYVVSDGQIKPLGSLRKNIAGAGVLLFCVTFTYMASINFIPISLLNTIKSTVPFWTFLFCYLFLKQHFHRLTLIALIPIVGGVAFASMNEVAFNATGFVIACSSAIFQTLYNLMAKDVLKPNSPMDHDSFQVWICFVASLCECCLLLCLLPTMESPSSVQHMTEALFYAILCSLNYYYEMKLSIVLIKRLGHLGYSVTDVVRRMVIIISSIFIFGYAVSIWNVFGIVTTMAGVLFYNYAQQLPVIHSFNG